MARVLARNLAPLGSHGMAAAAQRTIGLAEADTLLADFDRTTAAGMTMIYPAR